MGHKHTKEEILRGALAGAFSDGLSQLTKREALENVLIPYKLLENRELLLRTGFRSVDVFFKWYNFCGMVAVK